MSLWRQLARGLRALTHRSEADRDVDDEVAHYLEQAAVAKATRGHSIEEARRITRLELGTSTNIAEQVRGYGWEHAVETLVADLRYACRRLRSAPGFTGLAVLTLGLGIGATTTIFSAVHPILFAPLPYPDAERISMVWEIGADASRIDGTFGMFRELTDRSRSFDGLAAVRAWQPTMTGPDQPERFDGQRVSASYFDVLGVRPGIGRAFASVEDRPGQPNVVVVSDALWRRRFGADPAILGRQITLDDVNYAVIGVMPAGFENIPAPSAELWAPLQYDLSQGRAWGHHLRLIGRLRQGVSAEQAKRELDGIGQAVLNDQKPETYGAEVEFLVTSLQEDVTRGVRPALIAVFGAAALLLLIACANVTNLLLARGAQRRGELALRTALGAGHGRLMRQLLTESLTLAVLGGAAGMGLAILGVRSLVALGPPGLPRLEAIRVDGAAFAFALVLTGAVGLVFGMTPAVRAARSDPREHLHGGSRRTAGGYRRLRSALVVGEVALALVLLVGSGLLLRSLQQLFAIDAGFHASDVLTVQVQTSGERLEDDSATRRFFTDALENVRRLPGVTAAALTSQLPLSGDEELFGVRFDPAPVDDPGEVRGTFRYAVSPGYIEAMGISLVRGRTLTDRDDERAPPVALISEALAKRRLPGVDPIGRRLSIGPPTPLYTVVGVVGDVKQLSLALAESEAVYTTMAQWRYADPVMSLVIRARGDAAALAPAVRQAVWSVDKDQPIVRVVTMDELLTASAAERRFVLNLFEAFGLAALVLAAAGLYGVLAGNVTERTREIGVRSALGATRGAILALVVRQGMALTALGALIGVAAAFLATRAVVALLFGVTRTDPATYLGVLALIAGVALVACTVPAWRAARVDPAGALRAE